MTRAEAIEFLTKNKGRKVRSSIGAVYGWDSQLGVVNLGDADFVICYDYGGYEPVPEEPSLPVNFPPNWEPVETREEAEYMGGGRVAFWSAVARQVLSGQAFLLTGDNFYVRVKR